VLPHDPQALPGIPGAELLVGPDGDRGGHLGSVGEVSGVVLDVHHERVHLGAVGEAHKLVEALAAERPSIDVEGAYAGGRPAQRGSGPADGLAARHREEGVDRPWRGRQLVGPAGRLLGTERGNVQGNRQNAECDGAVHGP
jgi:hypothetical protein